jgi:hypothetical protein
LHLGDGRCELSVVAASLLLIFRTPGAPSDTLPRRLAADLRIGSLDAPDYSLARVGPLKGTLLLSRAARGPWSSGLLLAP